MFIICFKNTAHKIQHERKVNYIKFFVEQVSSQNFYVFWASRNKFISQYIFTADSKAQAKSLKGVQ